MRIAVSVLVFVVSASVGYACWVHTAQPKPIELLEDHVRISIKENIATKVVTMTFHNPNSQVTEGEYFMEIEPGAVVDKFSVKVDGKELTGELLDAEKAKKIYESIVQQKKDPAILEYYGYQLLRVRLFPIQPHSNFNVQVTMTQTLRVENGVARIATLNTNPKAALKPLKAVSCVADIESSKPIRMIFSPTHDINIERATDKKVRVSYEKKDYLPLSPLTFYYAVDENDIGATLMTFHDPGEDKYFMLTITPKWDIRDVERLPRDIVFAIDTSGSMQHDQKMEQVKAALKQCIRSLRPGDAFNIVTYSTEAREWKEKLVEATDDIRAAALKYVESLTPRGGTAIQEALEKSLKMFNGRESVKILVFLTDGLPTIGETDPNKIAVKAKELNKAGARIFAFGVGYDLNTQLLDALAVQNGGDREYVRPNEDASYALTVFAGKIDSPVLASPHLSFEGVDVFEIYPKTLLDVFRGGQLLVLGRYKGEGTRTLKLTGSFMGKPREFTYTVDFGATMKHDFIPKLWGIKKIDYLLDQVRLNGPKKELVDEIVAVAKKYAIVTPYTSYLITEDAPSTTRVLEESRERSFSGKGEFDKARNQMDWKKADTLEAQRRACSDALGYSTAGAERELMKKMRQISNCNFYNESGVWRDSRIDVKKKYDVVEVEFGSEAYWQLLRDDPSLARYFSIGRKLECLNKENKLVRVK